MRIGVIGAGLAGALLAWRLAQAEIEVVLVPGAAGAADASAVSGGSVRAFEVDPAQFELALASMAELAADRRLAEWAGFVRCGSDYLPTATAGLAEAAARINAALPGSAEVLAAAELARDGWAGVASGTLAVRERLAGYVDPDQFRRRVLTDLGQRAATVLPAAPATEISDGSFTVLGRRYECDRLVLATGGWTPRLLAEAGFDPGGLRTKRIQYTLHRASGVPAGTFVDEHTELFGRPTADGILLGLPTQDWDVVPGATGPDVELSRQAAERIGPRRPDLQLGAVLRIASAVDCYAPDSLLRLRLVPSAERLLSFTGGSGGSVKTALAASARAAAQLSRSSQPEPQHELERSA